MKEHTKTHETHGFKDHFHVKPNAKKFRFDRSKKLDTKIADTVWDIIQGKVDPSTITTPDEPNTVYVPEEYVKDVAKCIFRYLQLKGYDKGVTVSILNDQPVVLTEYAKEIGGLLNGKGEPVRQLFQNMTNCLPAYMAGLHYELVGNTAADFFIKEMNKAKING